MMAPEDDGGANIDCGGVFSREDLIWRSLRRSLSKAISGDEYWTRCFDSATDGNRPSAVHLAVFVEPFLQYVLDGRKTVESRFSVRRIAPYCRVHPGDVVLLKRAGGPVVGLCRVADVWFYRLDPSSWNLIRKEFTVALCAQDPAFWESRRSASFATLMRLDRVRAIRSFNFPKRDRRGWVVLSSSGGAQGAGRR